MKIKNTKELKLRANWHAQNDHIRQGTYGYVNLNGHTKFQGCAIGCLSTPHRQSGLRSFLKRLFPDGTEGDWYELNDADNPLYDTDQVTLLGKEFGITPFLARSAEAIFEGCQTHGEAIEFIPRFAAALPEGIDISPKQVLSFWENYLEENSQDCPPYPEGICVDGSLIEGATDAFLRWLKSLGGSGETTCESHRSNFSARAISSEG